MRALWLAVTRCVVVSCILRRAFPGRSGACNGQHVPERMKDRMIYSVFSPYPSGHGHPGMTNSSGIEREVAVHMDTIKIT